MNNSHIIKKLLISFLISFFFIWIVGVFFCNSLIYYKFDTKLSKFIHAPNLLYKHRSEGFADTHIGLFGINAINDASKDKRKKIIIWGDSYVEAHQVDDKFKMAQLVSDKLSKIGLDKFFTSIAIGMSDDSVADYYFDIPKYEHLLTNIDAHYIILTDIRDILPDQTTDNKRGIFSSNPLRLYHDNWKPRFQTIKKALNDYKLYFIWEPIRMAILSISELRFMPNFSSHKISSQPSIKINFSTNYLIESWTYLFKKLKAQTKLPIVFVYCPELPIIENNRILFDDKDAVHMELMKKIAAKYNIKVIDATSSFITFFNKTRIFPRGFPNSRPSEGHFNKYGHEIIAELILNNILDGRKH